MNLGILILLIDLLRTVTFVESSNLAGTFQQSVRGKYQFHRRGIEKEDVSFVSDGSVATVDDLVAN